MKVQSAPTQFSGLSDKFKTLGNQAEIDRYQSVVTLDRLQAPVADNSQANQPKQARRHSSAAIFGSTFLTIFLAECGDKTQLSTLLMSAESQSPLAVFLGAASALILTSLLGVLIGQWLSKRFKPKTLETAAGVSLLLVAVSLLWDVVQF